MRHLTDQSNDRGEIGMGLIGMGLIGKTGNSNRDFDQVPPGVCPVCDGHTVLFTGAFGGEPNKSVTCSSCNGTGKN